MSISWVEFVLDPTCKQNTDRTLPPFSSDLFFLFFRRSSTFLLWAPCFRPLMIWSVPPLQLPPSFLSSPWPPSGHTEQLAILSVDPGLLHFLFCLEPLGPTLTHSLWVSSTVTTSNGQPPSPAVSCQCLPLSSTTPYVYLSYVILSSSSCLPVFPTDTNTCH